MFFQQLVNGITAGGMYALIALGYTMVYGILKIINFAHGDIFMIGSFIGLILVKQVHLGLIPAMVISMVIVAFLGVIVERIAYRPLRNSAKIVSVDNNRLTKNINSIFPSFHFFHHRKNRSFFK